jgi:hypothetical protein
MCSPGLSDCRQRLGDATGRTDQNAQLFDKLRRFLARRISTGRGIFSAGLCSF